MPSNLCPFCARGVLKICFAMAYLGITVSAFAQVEVINEDIKLVPDNGLAFDITGWSIAIDNGIVVVGAQGSNHQDEGSDSGSAYLFDAFTGVTLHKLLSDDGSRNDTFGLSVAIDGGYVVVGAPRDDDNGTNSGSAYLFEVATGMQVLKFLPNDGAALDEFGHSVAIENGVVAVGAPKSDGFGSNSGSVYLFDIETGNQLRKIVPSFGSAGDYFGVSIALSNGILAVGSPGDNDSGVNSGSVYIYSIHSKGIDSDNYIKGKATEIYPEDASPNNFFGRSVALENEKLVVGSLLDYMKDAIHSCVYVFDWELPSQVLKIIPDDKELNDWFGWQVALSGDYLVAGSAQDGDGGFRTGSAYIYDVNTGSVVFKLLPSDGTTNDSFGTSVDIENDTVVVGSPYNPEIAPFAGAAYVFDLVNCQSDMNGDGVLDFFDISMFLAAFASGDLVVDFDGNGVLDFFDISIFLTEFSKGCS